MFKISHLSTFYLSLFLVLFNFPRQKLPCLPFLEENEGQALNEPKLKFLCEVE